MNDPLSSELNPDTIISGGTVYDGSGALGFFADVALKGDLIVAIKPELTDRFPHAKVYDAKGKAVSPGFIDIHTHSDLSVLFNRDMTSSVHQGVTTEMTGNCGFCASLLDPKSHSFAQERGWMEREGVEISWSRLSEFYDRLEGDGISSNIASLIGHGTIRKKVMGFDHRPPTPDELVKMQNFVADAMQDGAFGLSTGLEYMPGGFAQHDEICVLAEIAHVAGGFYASHLRNEGDTLIESVNEAIAVGEQIGLPVQLSHHKSEGKANWGKVRRTLIRMQEARSSGLDILTDQYPYTAFMTGLALILLPEWSREGSPEEMLGRLKDDTIRRKIESDIATLGHDYSLIQVGIARKQPELQGLTLQEIGRRQKCDPASAGIDLLIAENGFVLAAHFAISEEDVALVLSDSHTMIGSDGVATSPKKTDHIHPRGYGTFPRVLGRYVREHSVLTLADAIYRMTGLPASRMKLNDRGQLRIGNQADVVVFDPATIKDCATFESPHQFPTGIDYVFVNGILTVDHNIHTGARSGKALRNAV